MKLYESIKMRVKKKEINEKNSYLINFVWKIVIECLCNIICFDLVY